MRSLHTIGRTALKLAVVSTFGLLLCACNANGGGTAGAGAIPMSSAPRSIALAQPARDALRKKVKHVVIIVQENRSFDNLFQGFPGADTQSYGYNESGEKITLQQIPLETDWDLPHDSYAFITACDGTGSIPGTDCKMNGFDDEGGFYCGSSCPSNPPYGYVPHTETAPYFDMGEQYVLADRMFASNFDESSFISHQYIIAAQAEAAFNFPYGAWGCEGGPSDQIETLTKDREPSGDYIAACFTDNSLGEELDDAGKSWRYYTTAIYGSTGGLWNAYQANSYVYNGPDWSKNVITPQTQFFTDLSNGYLASMTWITPTCANSDHAGCGSNTGPAWVASLVNAIGSSKFWKTTMIFIFWDDPGGWYEHVPPKYVDYDGLGMRIPLLMISPYAKVGCITHVHYEHGSMLKFVEKRFGLAALAASDARANDPANDPCLDFSQTPRTFTSIPSAHDKAFFMHQPLDLRPVDTE
jgi:phospholipase C